MIHACLVVLPGLGLVCPSVAGGCGFCTFGPGASDFADSAHVHVRNIAARWRRRRRVVQQGKSHGGDRQQTTPPTTALF